MNGEKFAVHLQLDNRISARQVRSRPYERHREKRHDVQTATLLPFVRAAVYACLRRAIHFVRKGAKAGSFAFDYGAGDNDTPVARHNRPGGRPWVVISKTPGEPASGCKRSTRLPCSHVCGGRAANTAQKSNQMMKTTLSLTSDPCGAERNVLRRIRLPSTVAETGEMPYGTTNVS